MSAVRVKVRSAVAGLIVVFSAFLLTACQSEEVVYMDELRGIADQINRKCPQMLDSETRLDGIEVTEPNTIIYKYTLVNLLSDNVDTVMFCKAMWPGLVGNIKVSHDMKKLRDNSTTVIYSYNDKLNKPICKLRIKPEDYRK